MQKKLDKIQHPFVVNILIKLGIEKNFLNLTKNICKETVANIILIQETSCLPTEIKSKLRMFPVTTPIQHLSRSPSYCKKTRKGNNRNIGWEGRLKTVLVHRRHVYV
jgi:hypothetical protein